jgi:hypothetical protein
MSTDDTTPLPTSAAEPVESTLGTSAAAPATPPADTPLGVPRPYADVPVTKVPVDAAVDNPVEPPRPRLRVSTAVWGLVIAAIGVGIVALASGAVFDLQLALITLLAVAGLAMLAGSVAAATRHRRT